MIKAALPALLFVAAITSPASAQTAGNYLHNSCKENNLYALGYAVAVTDFAFTDLRHKICFPEGATMGQAEDIVCGFLETHPERRHEDAHVLAVDALSAAFPCNN